MCCVSRFPVWVFNRTNPDNNNPPPNPRPRRADSPTGIVFCKSFYSATLNIYCMFKKLMSASSLSALSTRLLCSAAKKKQKKPQLFKLSSRNGTNNFSRAGFKLPRPSLGFVIEWHSGTKLTNVRTPSPALASRSQSGKHQQVDATLTMQSSHRSEAPASFPLPAHFKTPTML